MATEELKTNVELDTNVKKVQIQRYEPEDFPETHYLNEEKGLRAWLTTVDHKKIGLMYLGSTTFFFFVGGILAIILRTELFTPTRSFIDADVYNQLFTLHGAIMVFLFLVPVVRCPWKLHFTTAAGGKRCCLPQVKPGQLLHLCHWSCHHTFCNPGRWY